MSHPRINTSTLRISSISSSDVKEPSTPNCKTQRHYRIRQASIENEDSMHKLSLSSLNQSIQYMEKQWNQVKTAINASPRSARTHSTKHLSVLKSRMPIENPDIVETCMTDRSPKQLKHKFPKIPLIRKKGKYLVPLAQIYLGDSISSARTYTSASPKASCSTEAKTESPINHYINSSPKAKSSYNNSPSNTRYYTLISTPKEISASFRKTECAPKISRSFNISKWISNKLHSSTRNMHFPTNESSAEANTNI